MTQASDQVLRQLALRFGIIGESASMVHVNSRLLQVAPTDLSVLITGETGTGKEIFAHAVHDLSGRKKFPFVSVNCGAIPETLLESELFGAERGAFTGSVEQRKGFFETANRGTIFLDEIGEMPIGTQVKLLRILESGEYSRLGSSDVLKVNVRVVTATNRDLAYEVRQGKFRQDLFFRLNSVHLALPPLRQHVEDIPVLVQHFAERIAEKIRVEYRGIEDAAVSMLQSLTWPGNVRELRNLVETMVTLEQGARITSEIVQRYLPAPSQNEHLDAPSMALMRIPEQSSDGMNGDIQILYRTLLQLSSDVAEIKTVLRNLLTMSVDIPTVRTISEIVTTSAPPAMVAIPADLDLSGLERKAIEAALRRTQGNRRESAELLGISERTLYRKIDEYGLQ